MKEIIKNIDILGYPINLNFKKRGSNYLTVLGGIFSVVNFGFILFYYKLI